MIYLQYDGQISGRYLQYKLCVNTKFKLTSPGTLIFQWFRLQDTQLLYISRYSSSDYSCTSVRVCPVPTNGLVTERWQSLTPKTLVDRFRNFSRFCYEVKSVFRINLNLSKVQKYRYMYYWPDKRRLAGVRLGRGRDRDEGLREGRLVHVVEPCGPSTQPGGEEWWGEERKR